jgi:hypothetical protein
MTEQCYKNVLSLQDQLPEAKIVVVNNNSTNTSYLDKLPETITVEDNVYPSTYEAGALLHAFNKYDFENYFLIQDSIEMYDCFEIIDYTKQDYEFVFALNLFCPASHMTNDNHKNYIKTNFKSLSYLLFMQAGIATNSFIAKKHHIQKIVDAGIFVESNLPKNKLASECWERVFGLAFYKNKIKLKTVKASYDRKLMSSINHLSQTHIEHVLKMGEKFHKYILARS